MVTVHIRLNSFLSHTTPDSGVYEIQVALGTRISTVIDIITTQHTPQLKTALLDRTGSLNSDLAVILDHNFIPSNRIDAVKIEKDCSSPLTMME